MAINDVRKNLPKGLNDVDMKEDGTRSGPCYIYGDPFSTKMIFNAFAAWGVTKFYLINSTGLMTNAGWPDITTCGGPEFMARFGDGMWRYCKFGGCNGPPWFWCSYRSYDAPNGESACIMDQLAITIGARTAVEAEVARLGNRIDTLEKALAVAKTKNEDSK